MRPALEATMQWGMAVGLVVLIVPAVRWWFEFCWGVSDGHAWEFGLFLSPFAVLLWFSFYLEALEGV